MTWPVPRKIAHKNGRGRPPKYDRPSRAVTVTLPDDVLGQLHAVDPDLGRAIVRVTESGRSRRRNHARAAELTSYGNHAVIVVTPLRALKRLQGVELVPIGDGRALISLAPDQSVSQFELALRDASAATAVDAGERGALREIADILKRTRGTSGPRLRERTIMVLEARRRR